MSQKIVGDSSVKFGLEGASQDKMGIVESVSLSQAPDTIIEARGPKGDYETGKSQINFQGERTDITVTGYCKDTSLAVPGETLTFSKPTDMKTTLPTSMYVVSSEVTGSVGEFVRVSITGVAHKNMTGS